MDTNRIMVASGVQTRFGRSMNVDWYWDPTTYEVRSEYEDGFRFTWFIKLSTRAAVVRAVIDLRDVDFVIIQEEA